MSLYTVTSNPTFADIVNAALKAETRVCVSANDAITVLLSPSRPKTRFLVLDLATIADAGRTNPLGSDELWKFAMRIKRISAIEVCEPIRV